MSSDGTELHINFERSPLIEPTDKSPHILIIGAGIVGLSTAWTLLDSGYKVTVVAERFADRVNGTRLTSQIAGALWEYPPAVCGHTSNMTTLESSKRWSMISYHVYNHMAADPVLARDFSVQMRETVFFFDKPVKDDPAQLRKMREIERSGIAGFRHDPRAIHDAGLDKNKWVDAYEIHSPLIDTDVSLVRIQQLVKDKGANIVKDAISSDLLKLETELLQKYKAHAIVNASGLGSSVLANDPNVYPLRGAVLRLLNDGQKFNKLKKALVVSATAEGNVETEFIFIVPRNNNILYVGGFSEPDHTDNLGEDDPKLKKIADNAKQFMPELDTDYRDHAYPYAQGLRPARHGDIRCERELRPPVETNAGGAKQSYSRVVHCYGHAGAGWSLSFGTALEVKSLVDSALAQEEPTPMEHHASSTVSQAQVQQLEKSGALKARAKAGGEGLVRDYVMREYCSA